MASATTETDQAAQTAAEEKKTQKDKKTQKAERVEIFIPRAVDGEERTLFVSVNGVNYLLPKGKTSKVPYYIAEEIRRSWKAVDDAEDRADALHKASQEPTALG